MDFDNEIERVSFFCVDKMLGGEIFNLFCLSCFKILSSNCFKILGIFKEMRGLNVMVSSYIVDVVRWYREFVKKGVLFWVLEVVVNEILNGLSC